jgi:DNA-directed RNA polymerase specialized sigma24 family protein
MTPAESSPDDLAPLLRRLLEDWHDEAARTSLIEASKRLVASAVRSVLGPNSSCQDDVEQETWLSFFKERREYALANARVFKSFLYKTARGYAMHAVRAGKRDRPPADPPVDIPDPRRDSVRWIFVEALHSALQLILADRADPHMTIVFLGNRVLRYKPEQICLHAEQHLADMLEEHLAEIALHGVKQTKWNECCRPLRNSMHEPACSADFHGPKGLFTGMTILLHYERDRLARDIPRWTQVVVGRFVRAALEHPEFQEWIDRMK